MTRARAWVARKLVSFASRLIGAPLAGGVSVEPEEDEEDLPMPAGHPVVVRSERANEMLLEGDRRARPNRKKVESDAPLAGSLQDRMNRRDL